MISTKGRYALRVMIDLAEHSGDGAVPLKDIAERQEISKKYLEIIVKDLVNGRLIKGSAGRAGGYVLCRKAEDIKVGEIIELTEGPITAVACLAANAEKCPRSASCRTLPLWIEYENTVRDFFYSKKLSDLL